MASEEIVNKESGVRLRNEVIQPAKETATADGKPQSGSFFGLEWDKPGSSSPWPTFDKFPEHLREGAWSPVAYIFLVAFVSFMAISAPWAYQGLSALTAAAEDDSFTRILHGVGAVYLASVIVFTYRRTGLWPFVSYTAISYMLLTLRFAFVFAGLQAAAEILRFPVIAMATVTSTVWWLVLFPTILTFASREQRPAFLRMNFSVFLFNMHLLNFPIALASQVSSARPLVFLDFWVAAVVAMLYLFFYLLVMDANGLHLYIILSPRPWWCAISYSGILLIYVQLFRLCGS